MPKYRYAAVSTAGDKISGIYEASDPSRVTSMLRSQNYYPVEIRALADRQSVLSMELNRKIALKDIATFCQQISTVLRAGVPLSQALDIMRGQTLERRLKRVLDDVYEKINQGNSLTEAFYPHRDRFPMLFLNMIEAGELSGSLDACLERAGETFLKNHKLQSKVRGTLIYPVFLGIMTLAVLVFLLIYIVPQFATVFEQANSELPPITLFMLSVSDFLQMYWLTIVLVIAAVIVAFRLWLSTDAGRTSFDHFKLRIPVIGRLLTIVAASRYTRTLSTLQSAGVALTACLDVTARSVNNRYMEKKIYEMVDSVRIGEALNEPLARSGIFPPMIAHMTRLGEESGMLDDLMRQTSAFYEDEADAALKKLTALLEPVIIAIMGVVVLLIIMSVMVPMFSMLSAFE